MGESVTGIGSRGCRRMERRVTLTVCVCVSGMRVSGDVFCIVIMVRLKL